MNNHSEQVNPFLDEEFIAKLLRLFGETAIEKCYEYIEVYEGSWRNFFRKEQYGFIINGAYEDKVKNISGIELFNRLGSKGWKLVDIVSKISKYYTGEEKHTTIQMSTYAQNEFYEIEESGYQEIPVHTFPQSSLNCEYTYIFQRKVSKNIRKQLSSLLNDLDLKTELKEQLLYSQQEQELSQSKSEVDPAQLSIEELGLSETLEQQLKEKGIILVSDLVNQIKSLNDLDELDEELHIGYENKNQIETIFSEYLGITLEYVWDN